MSKGRHRRFGRILPPVTSIFAAAMRRDGLSITIEYFVSFAQFAAPSS
jgi:hypothetical protein